MTRQKALITGASSGIGKSYARKLAARGHDLTLVARDHTRLAALAQELAAAHGITADILVADLTQSEGVAAVEAAFAQDSALTFFLNNAGAAIVTPITETSAETIETLVALNVTAAARLQVAAARAFVARGQGTIVAIASIVAVNPERFNGIYGGSKSFLHALTLSMHRELAGKGVTFQSVLPGATRTEIWERAGKDPDTLDPAKVMDTDTMVEAALAGLALGELITIPSLPDAGDLAAAEQARLKMSPNLSWHEAAARYRS